MASLQSNSFRIYYGPADDPLNNFYIPALSASVQYDRSAGFFSSTALAIAAAGVVQLIQNGGRMRLLVGAQLDAADVDAISKGHDLSERVTVRLLEHFIDPQDALQRQRLEVLAWMVAEGTLDIKVVLPRDERGLPIPASETHDYYHPKTGIFTDAEGNRIAFSGSVNESETAWLKNFEQFSVYTSWAEGQSYLPQVALMFERLWTGQESDWIALDIPQAVRSQLLKYRPYAPPQRDPLQPKEVKKTAESTGEFAYKPTQRERILFQFVRDAPYLPDATTIAAATGAIIPWPHQSRVADSVIERYPDRAMLSDEVGLGKTIEAGLAIRQLILSGRVKRCLILAPKSVVKQWQEELYEKFVLDVPRYDARFVFNADNQQLDGSTDSPWDDYDLLLAGSQLAKRADRRDQLLAAKPWDLIVIDEAHHARRKDFKERIYRPNRLLGLINDLNAHNKTTSLLLLTATPMQVHALEVWDLLTTLGMGGRWGADEESFLAFYAELRKPYEDIDWQLVFTLVQDHLNTGGQIDPSFKSQVSKEIGPVKWAMLEDLLQHPEKSDRILAQLGKGVQSHIKELAHRHTPLSRYVYRNTRSLLREYQKQGILKENVPFRRPSLKRVPMREEEKALYLRIEEYISHFYQQYENERRGLGFVMTVYRRRLTSSFYAVRRSLERRYEWLRGRIPSDSIFDDDDTEQEELDHDITEENTGDFTDRERFKAELVYVEDFIRVLRTLSDADSKLEWLKAELRQTFRERPTALVFTQYTDTMDYLRDQLVIVYGSQVACYSGRGGEVWNGIAWVTTTKEAVKTSFAKGDLSVMLCTESASEGLNLQTCGVLINYDMPWNPMRVEQRIGRIDRIGQVYKTVWISNYFYQDTIEDQIYQRLADRIDWFEVVVGDLQPILAEVGEVTRRLAMLPASEREAQLEKEIAELKKRLDNRQVESLNLDQYMGVGNNQTTALSPITLAELEQLLTTSNSLRHLFTTHPAIPEAYLLTWRGTEHPVTFSRKCVDEHTDSVQFLSYGNKLFRELLGSIEPPAGTNPVIRCATDGAIPICVWYSVDPTPDRGRIEPIRTLAQLKQAIVTAGTAPRELDAQTLAAITERFDAVANDIRAKYTQALELHQKAQQQALLVKAQRLLVKAALVEIALGQQASLFDAASYPTAFNEQAIMGLQRHRYPWAPLLQLAYRQGMAPHASDLYYEQIANRGRDQLRGIFTQLQEEAKKMVRELPYGN